VSEAFETCHAPGGTLSMHRHTSAYVALVLEGAYEERSVDGRFRLSPGALIYHPPYHAHLNAFLSDQVRVLNIELPGVKAGAMHYRATSRGDFETFERLMRECPNQTLGALNEVFGVAHKKKEPAPRWIGVLARALAMESDARPIKELARRLGVSPEHASRKFQKEFGVGPATFRREQRLRRSLAALEDGETLVCAAMAGGFADQSHMGRAFKAALGETPGALAICRGKVS